MAHSPHPSLIFLYITTLHSNPINLSPTNKEQQQQQQQHVPKGHPSAPSHPLLHPLLHSLFSFSLVFLFINSLTINICIVTFQESGEHNNKMINKIKSNGDDEYECVYTVYVQTGTKVGAGTDSVISLTLTQKDGHGVLIKNLEAWGGIMGSNHDYFEAGNLDIFSGRGPCLSSTTPCRMNLTSDGTGSFPDWYCNYVEVTTTRPRGLCAQRLFSVGQWLNAGKPFAVRDYCSSEPEDGNRWPAAPRRNIAA